MERILEQQEYRNFFNTSHFPAGLPDPDLNSINYHVTTAVLLAILSSSCQPGLRRSEEAKARR